MGKEKSDTRQKRADTVHNQLLMGAIDRRKAKKGFIKRSVSSGRQGSLTGYSTYCTVVLILRNAARQCGGGHTIMLCSSLSFALQDN